MRFIYAKSKYGSVPEWLLLTDKWEEAKSVIEASIDKHFLRNPHLFREGIPQCLTAIMYSPLTLIPLAKESFDTILKRCKVVVINRNGGMSPIDMYEIVYTKELNEFPKEPLKPKQYVEGTHWYIGDKKFNTYNEAENYITKGK
jgi:hypothetical protein